MTKVLLLLIVYLPVAAYGQEFWYLAEGFPGGAKTAMTGIDDSVLFTGTNQGVWRSEKAGENNSWQHVLKGGTVGCLIATEDGKIAAGGNGKIYYSFNKGTTWDSVALESGHPVRQIVRNSKGELFAITGSLDLEQGFIGDGVMYNDGSFNNWQKRNNGLSTYDLFGSIITVDGNDRLYLATANEYGRDKSGLFTSNDAGMTWTSVEVRIDGLGVIEDKLTVHFVRGLSILGDSLWLSFNGTAGSAEVSLNLTKHRNDFLTASNWNKKQINKGLSWWLDRVLNNVHVSKKGIMYSSVDGTINVGGTYVSEHNGINWMQERAGLGLSETGTFRVQYFYETSFGKIFMVQHLDERLYFTDKSVLDPVKISGKVLDLYGRVVNSVLLKAGTTAGSRTTNLSDGSYSFKVQKGWSGTIIPERGQFVFSPPQITISSLQSDTVDVDFIGTYEGKYYVSGSVVDFFGNYIPEVEIKGFSSAVKTNENGYFVAEVDATWSGFIEPFHESYAFEPAKTEIRELRSDLTDQNFRARKKGTLAVTGNFNGEFEGRINFTGLQMDWHIFSDGKYVAMVPERWNGSIVPQLEGYLFTPDTLFVFNLQNDLFDQNFMVSSSLAVQGTVKDTNGTPIGDVGLQGFPGFTKTDHEGKFVTSVPKGWSGSFSAIHGSYRFIPEHISVQNLESSLQDQDFTGTFITSVNDPVISEIKLFPNPSSDGHFILQLPENLQPVNVRLFDPSGRSLTDVRFDPLSKTIKFFIDSHGIYILKISTAEGTGSIRIAVH